jgi:hypothetical protein
MRYGNLGRLGALNPDSGFGYRQPIQLYCVEKFLACYAVNVQEHVQ